MNALLRKMLLRQSGIVRNGLVAWYKFNEGAGQVLRDNWGANNGQLGSTAGADTNDPAWGSGYLDFNGDDNYVVIPDATALDITGAVTIMVCLQLDSGPAADLGVIAKDDAAQGLGYGLYQPDGSSGIKMQIRVGAAWIDNANARTPEMGLGQPLVVAGRYDGALVQMLYGADCAKTAGVAVNGSIATNNYDLLFGRFNNGANYFDGRIYQVLLYNRALTDAEYLRNYAAIKQDLLRRGITI